MLLFKLVLLIRFRLRHVPLQVLDDGTGKTVDILVLNTWNYLAYTSYFLNFNFE